jgi:hypothetical protein
VLRTKRAARDESAAFAIAIKSRTLCTVAAGVCTGSERVRAISRHMKFT